jgi:methyltransferase (TIGR00027 family)
VAVDLNKDDIDDRLTRSGFDRTLKTLFILEGVTMYITPEAVDNILAFIGADAAKDSSVIFNYHRRFDHSVLPTMSKNARPLIATSLQKTPSGFFMEDNAIEKFLAQKGLKLVENVTGEFFKLVYFRGKNSQQPVCCRCGFIKAVVKA